LLVLQLLTSSREPEVQTPNSTEILSTDALRRDWRQAARIIDHTLLKPDATRAQLTRLCCEAAAYGFYSVCVNPANIAHCHAELRGTGVAVCAVIGFPLGATTTTAKLAEASDALRLGARELDMVLNIGALKGGEHEMVQMEMRALARLCHASGARLKVILETALLTHEEKILACNLALAAEADFVKTSTGFATIPSGASGATVEDVELMRSVVGERMGVKASGGIRGARELLAMVEAGANRIGASASVAIVREFGAPCM
jgi:deoxyribose-phosphate aldolase